jgi:putative ubiquitin-RnfH superfamily antitoxin RatB of RatAB toxin-antitoxin module
MAPGHEPGRLPSVEVVYARPDRQRVVALPLQEGMTALQAVAAAGLVGEFPEIGSQPLEIGIFGKRVDPARLLCDGDRVEIYRPLPDDPKERRRRRAAETAQGRRGRKR